MKPRVLAAYQMLQVAPWAGRDQIRRAYHAKAKQHHPDLQRTDGVQAEEMLRLNRAVQIVHTR